MPSNICLVETHAQSLEWDGSRYALDGKESRDTSERLRALLVHYLEELEEMDEYDLFDGANWALEVEREEERFLAICNKYYGNVISFDGSYPEAVSEMLWELQGGFPDEFKESDFIDKWPSWDDDRLYRWDDRMVP